jgi:8-oxo-dGTP pyrophosphatase MutT (NUDIX family)
MTDASESIKNQNKTGVTFILLRPSGEMLLQQRDAGNGKKIPYPDQWCFPGGKKESDESYIETVIREVYEEYNLSVNKADCTLIEVFDHDDIFNDHVYFCTIPQESHPVLKEGRDMQWKYLHDIKKLPLAWEQNKILASVDKYLKINHLS